MFTGIIKEIGIVLESYRTGKIHKLKIESKRIFKSVNTQDSVAVNGVCLTVVKKEKGVLAFDVIEETIRKTNLLNLKKQDLVNLEDSLKAQDALGGHFVLGHIDCLGTIKGFSRIGDETSMEIEFADDFSHLIVEKGSIALEGCSLTVGSVTKNTFKAYLIPHTLKNTTLSSKSVGDKVNLEFDIIGKYIARQREPRLKPPDITEKFLSDKGFR